MPRRRLRKLGLDLDGLTELAIRDLENFVRGNASLADAEAAKLFRARSDAAKMGLSLVEALMRLGDSLPPDETETSHEILARARAALARDEPEAQDRDQHSEE